MDFMHVKRNEKIEYFMNMDKIVVVEFKAAYETAAYAFFSIADMADQIMIARAEWDRIAPNFTSDRFFYVSESDTHSFVINKGRITHVEMNIGSFTYIYLDGRKDRLMLKPEVWAGVAGHFAHVPGAEGVLPAETVAKTEQSPPAG